LSVRKQCRYVSIIGNSTRSEELWNKSSKEVDSTVITLYPRRWMHKYFGQKTTCRDHLVDPDTYGR
jgi:hypothetical protein